jgi:hypothetical protein
LRHSARVRSWNLQSHHLVRLLSSFPSDVCIFPRLQSFTWMTHNTKYMYLFQSHKLRYCSILSAHEGIQSLVSRCAALEHLNIQFDASAAEEQSPLSNSVRLCKRLVNLSCPPLDWAAWTHLSNLPTLLSVEIHAPHSASHLPLKWNTISLSPFLNVTTLFFPIRSVAYIITVMEHSQFPSLTKFKVHHEVPSSAEFEQLFRALSRCQALKEIIVTFDGYRNNNDQDPGSFLTLVPRFLCFTQLKIFQLYLHGSQIYLDDNILLQVMSTWPQIRILEIQDSGLLPSHITFRELFTALRQCPHLRVLRVPVNITTIAIDPDAKLLPHTTLQRLGLEATGSDYIIENAQAIARIIFTLLPCVIQVNRSTIGEDWNAVNFHLGSLRAAARAAGAALND